jgi:penicillin-binding protein 1C
MNLSPFQKKRKWIPMGGLLALFVTAWYFSLPDKLFEDPYSTVLEDRQGNLLSASIAADGQWRFPEGNIVPEKYKKALISYEDKRFDNHFGVDLISLGRAVRQNISAGRIVSGGSTLSMQLIRLSRKGKPRSFLEKFREMFLATRLEGRYSKREIISMYSAHAPMGGNVVGIESACWRYFGRGPSDLSWSEAALLAVLPNNPSLIHPGKNRDRLKRKRDRLLQKLKNEGSLDPLALELAIAEPIPDNPVALPRYAHHLLHRMAKENHAQSRLISTLDLPIQQKLEQLIAIHYRRLQGNQIFNAAALILDVKTGNVLAYVGNTEAGPANQEDVDLVSARRSTGSILKPFLFAAMLEEGKMLQKTLLPDVPTSINGFTPRNFSHEYDGAVPADQALIRSLNIPMVYALKNYRYEKFYEILKQAGLTTLNRPPDHYGLTLVLGGAEGSLWDITGAYASMARTLNNYFEHSGKSKYKKEDFHAPRYDPDDGSGDNEAPLSVNSFLSAASIWLTFETLKELYRPGEETGWKYFNSSKKIAWKTGTSFGFRDGWAVGVNPDYVVGVWTGNADGEGRPGLVGSETAAPILFDIFSALPGQSWFRQPLGEMLSVNVCLKSGQRASENCEQQSKQWVVRAGLSTAACQYHKKIHVSQDEKFRVHSECATVDKMKSKSWFVLPPVQEFYYKSRNLSYRSLPPFRIDCEDPAMIASMALIYPTQNARIYIPKDLDGKTGNTVFEIAHRSLSSTLYWHLDGVYIGATKRSHFLAITPSKGEHILTVVDDAGETLQRTFEVLSSP